MAALGDWVSLPLLAIVIGLVTIALAVLGAIVATNHPGLRGAIIALGLVAASLAILQGVIQARDEKRAAAERAQHETTAQTLARNVEGLTATVKILAEQRGASPSPPIADPKKIVPALRYPYGWGYPATTQQERFWMRIVKPLRYRANADPFRLDLGVVNDNALMVIGPLMFLEIPEGMTVTDPGGWSSLEPNRHYTFGPSALDGNGGWAFPSQMMVVFKEKKTYRVPYRIRAISVPERVGYFEVIAD